MKKILLLFLILCSISAIPQTTHYVTLRWNQGKYPKSVIFYVYRAGLSTGPFARHAQVALTAHKWTDYNVAVGHTYWYFVTAYNPYDFEESQASDMVSTTIP